MNDQIGKYEKELLDILLKTASDRQLFRAFLTDILTPAEYEEIMLRWQIVKKLRQGVPQRKIAEELGVGIATVTRGSRELQDDNGGFAKVWRRFFDA